jgi:uncharacterized protein YgbK (DUF1537 family)
MDLTIQTIQQQVPPSPPEDHLPEIRKLLAETDKTIVVLDDDPTGTQSVYDIPVLTEWSSEVLTNEFDLKTPLFYILTNSRSLVVEEARALASRIGQNIKEASERTGRNFMIISRSDSTLRGHYPEEVDALLHTLRQEDAIKIIIPAFFEGGRYTFNDTHYVQEGDTLIPAANTPFAQDKSFGYQHSNLKKWIEEKTKRAVKAEEVFSFDLHLLRTKSVEEIAQQLKKLPPSSTCVVNALVPYDLHKFVLALLKSKANVLCRTAASFVAAMGGLAPRSLLNAEEVIQHQQNGGLIVVGSYVPKSSTQLKLLLDSSLLKAIELPIETLLKLHDPTSLLVDLSEQINSSLRDSRDVVLYTSRKLISGEHQAENLHIGKQISQALTTIIYHLSVQPRYLIAKGGITSNDIATHALGVKKAMVLGQLIPGVPVWKLGNESKYPDMRYIVFPGNVGNEGALLELVQKLERRDNG